MCISHGIVKCCINEGTRKGSRSLHERGNMKFDIASIIYTTRSLPIDINPAIHTYVCRSVQRQEKARVQSEDKL